MLSINATHNVTTCSPMNHSTSLAPMITTVQSDFVLHIHLDVCCVLMHEFRHNVFALHQTPLSCTHTMCSLYCHSPGTFDHIYLLSLVCTLLLSSFSHKRSTQLQHLPDSPIICVTMNCTRSLVARRRQQRTQEHFWSTAYQYVIVHVCCHLASYASIYLCVFDMLMEVQTSRSTGMNVRSHAERKACMDYI